MAWQIRGARTGDVETCADNLAWVVYEAQKVLGKTEHMFLLPGLCAEVGIEFGGEEAA